MSIPPQLIRVKRKATEEAPVPSFLRVQDNKRQRSDGYVYQRQNDEAAAFADIPTPVQRPIIHSSKRSYNGLSTAFQSPKRRRDPNAQGEDGAVPSFSVVDPNAQATATATANTVGASEPRRFHMSRQEMMLATRTHGGTSNKRSVTALFVERQIKRLPCKKFDRVALDLNIHATSQGISYTPDVPPSPVSLPEQMEVETAEPKKYKKPGRFAQKSGTPKFKAEIPSAITDRWNVDLNKLTADMDAFTMEQIGLNLQKTEQETQHDKEQEREQQERALKHSLQQRFKPKAPAKRISERHTETVLTQNMVDKEMVDASDTDDDDYIVETYVRVPASTIEKTHVPPQNVGLLVFDAEPDLALFYGDGTDSDDGWADDDEDENAENYYTADYPDEEVASDDEFGQNPYSYRNGNASDLEEFDLRDDNSDLNPDDLSEVKDGFRKFVGRNGLVTKHI